ncbi:flagellar motor protein MotB [Aureimonas sp. SA4125]|uniref:MotB family protein n=1 Tax=Aureimonas sp. SA4125 TaxID=2826993 RepID=UPI001CC43F3C|nr:MotB family protein [Aureimonas sp. SA4125]BDA85931.1 flagellar motor protein MotB [Aureimonas sp. SA4125]
MSQTSAAAPVVNQIIVVKRGGNQEEAHHGGAWKIAFADFMTALMALFLVLWLTNASDDATKKQIAQYFNPIKLNSSVPETLGLSNGENTPTKPVSVDSKGEVEDGGNPDEKPMSGSATGGQEQALFRDPFAVLAEIAAEGGPGVQDGVSGVPDGSGLPGLNGGEAYRDPFDPSSWQLSPNIDEKAAKDTAMAPQEFKVPEPLPPTTTVAETTNKTVVEVTKPAEEKPASPAATPEKPAEAVLSEAEKLKAEIEESLGPSDGPGVEVTVGKDGVKISLADSLTSGMFEVGSAKPTPDALKLVESVAKILSERKGVVSIRGHTDSRPYAGVEYDNWRLSSARAQFAYYMLVRGGLSETRVTSIEGVADRDPKDAANPESAQNRRIEILLKEPTT